MTMDNPIDILQHRTNCILYYAQPDIDNERTAGWIGGNAPAYFDDPQHLTHERQGSSTYLFYLTLVHPFHPERMISIFIPQDYEEYLEHNIYPHCAIKVVEHPMSTESDTDIFTHPSLIKHTISHGAASSDSESMELPCLIQVGGIPTLIQQEDYYMAGLQKESFSFFFQVDEEGYPETLLAEDGSYPFGFGALYVYATIEGDEIGQIVAGFWQFS